MAATRGSKTAIPPADRPFLLRMMRYLRIPRLGAVRVETPKSDIAVQLPRSGRGTPTLLIGRGWRRNRVANPRLAHTQLVHEGLHVVGYPHSAEMRRRGFFAFNRQKDRLSHEVYQAIVRGDTRFDAQQFGLDPRSLAERPGGPHRG